MKEKTIITILKLILDYSDKHPRLTKLIALLVGLDITLYLIMPNLIFY